MYKFFLNQLQSSEESCWLFEDEEGRKRGPHSLAQLYSWHHSGYLLDSLMVSDKNCNYFLMENCPFFFLFPSWFSLVNLLRM